jgi:hypothetical protein
MPPNRSSNSAADAEQEVLLIGIADKYELQFQLAAEH